MGVTVIRLKWKPNKSVSRQFNKIFKGNQPAINEVMEKAEAQIQEYWKDNVYSYFDARAKAGLPNTGQLGRSLRIKVSGTKLQFFMVPMHNDRTKKVEFDFRIPMFSGKMSFKAFVMPSMGVGRIKDYDYGELLRNGFSASNSGAYSYEKDCKVGVYTGGYHPGYDAKTRWVPWYEDFSGEARQILADLMIEKLKAAGATIKGQWRVDIVI